MPRASISAGSRLDLGRDLIHSWLPYFAEPSLHPLIIQSNGKRKSRQWGVLAAVANGYCRLRRAEPALYLIFAALCTLASAQRFIAARQSALRMAEAARQALTMNDPVRQLAPVAWSAPLDDVFIHFDFARSLAQGHFFEWSAGGGYSSGATSWLYPTILGAAYRLGFTGFGLGYFSDWFAALCVFGGFIALRRAFAHYSWWLHYLVVAAIAFQGLLAFALWSGMEFALFFLLWGCGQAAFQSLLEVATEGAQRKKAWLVGLLGVLLAATRPESVLCLAIWAIFATRSKVAPRNLRTATGLVVRMLGPCCLYLVTRALVNRTLTGEFADAGSLAKLVFLAPHSSIGDLLWVWLTNLGFQFGRITAYHSGQYVVLGCLLWVPVLGSLLLRRARADAQVLATMSISWMCLVASNEYVRYQNDRYTMAPLAWLIMCGAFGTHEFILVTLRRMQRARTTFSSVVPALLALFIGLAWWQNQAPRWRQQVWLFSRASRNIAEQQVRLGQLLGADPEVASHRLLLGDAGALQYFSSMPGLDAFGLGTTHDLPFAKAVRLGNGATVELIERLAPWDRPDLMALYPSWWKDLPLWFGHRALEVDIAGNVMCGARNKVLYFADWRGLENGSLPINMDPNWHVADELDVADLVSEADHGFTVSRSHSGYVFMKLLPLPQDSEHDLFDAGRVLFDGDQMRFNLSHLTPGRPLRLVLRAAPHAPMQCRVLVDGRDRGILTFTPSDSWVELSIDIRATADEPNEELLIRAEHSECNLFHIWTLQPD